MAAATQHEAAGARGQVGDGVEEPGLADAGLALDQQQAGRARRGEPGPGALDLRQLGLAPHQERSLDVVAGRRLGRKRGLPEHGEVQVSGLAVRSRAEVLAQACGQLVVRREGGSRPAVGHERAHQGADGLLVVRVRRHAHGSHPGALGGLQGGQCVGEQVPGAATQGVGLVASAPYPVGVALVDQRRLGPQEREGGAGGGCGEHRLTRGRASPRLGRQPCRLVEVDQPWTAER